MPADQFALGADVLDDRIGRGDWDDETCDEMAAACAQLRAAADGRSVNLRGDQSAALWGVLGSDARADTGLRDLVAALGVMLAPEPVY